MKFSKSQIEAINHNFGPALVLAVPGSGKTTVLLERISRLIQQGINPNSILSMTFSKSQAKDMEIRFNNRYGNLGVKFSTIHSFAYGIVRSFHSSKIYLIEEKFNKVEIVSRIFMDVRGKKINDEQIETFFRVSGFIKNTLMDYSEYKKKYSSAFSKFEEVYAYYEKFKKDNNLIDFDDMLLLAFNILKSNKFVLDYVQNKFNFFQIDEGQDTSLIQFKIISLISKRSKNLFVVADDDQSIYGFRGADSLQLLNFKESYPDAKLYYMQENYRSVPIITKYANELIKNNNSRYLKIIKPVNKNIGNINIIKFENTTKQINFVVEKAIEHQKNDQTTAILYRNNLSAINLINTFPDYINYNISDGKLAIYTNPIIQDIIDTINFSRDLHDLKTFERIYFKFNFYIKRDFINQIRFMEDRLDVIDRLMQCEDLSDFFLDKIYLMSFHFERLQNLNFEKAVKYIFEHMEYYEYLNEFARQRSDSMVTIDRIIDTVINISKGLETVKDFENKISSLIEIQKKHSKNTSPIFLSTVHGSKGLEFDNVYLIDVIDKEFPGLYIQNNKDPLMLEEERRLFYVAITRAKNNLNIIYTEKLFTNNTKKSIFIEELNYEREKIDEI